MERGVHTLNSALLIYFNAYLYIFIDNLIALMNNSYSYAVVNTTLFFFFFPSPLPPFFYYFDLSFLPIYKLLLEPHGGLFYWFKEREGGGGGKRES